jgi:hypothetical protein
VHGQSLAVVAAWCTQFKTTLRHQSLVFANRPPALFVNRLGKHLATANIVAHASLFVDENLGRAAVASDALTAIASCDIAFLSSHGRYATGDYQFKLRNGNWTIAGTLGNPGPAVLVLDTCDLIDATDSFGASSWLAKGTPTPGVILGFVGPASDSYESATRGAAFAENLALGSTFARAWIDGVKATNTSGRDQPIAIAFGPTQTDAQATLESASLLNLPQPTVADACYWITQ